MSEPEGPQGERAAMTAARSEERGPGWREERGLSEPEGRQGERVHPWRLAISHRTEFGYQGEVGSSFNEARMTPLTERRQTTLDARVEISPAARTYRYRDYWGTQVTAFDLHLPHRQLAVTARAVVETLPAPAASEALDWAALATPEAVDRWCEYLLPTGLTEIDEELADRARQLRATSPTPRGAAHEVCDWVRDEVAYVPGSTGVQTDARQAWRQRKGVCQDLSHLTVGLLRQLGVPARYVSGYLHPVPESPIGEPVVGQSHAWIEWWDGAWTGFDPTNGLPVGVRHVVVGRGRDYEDVPPLRGVYAGPESTTQGVEVTVTRLS